MKIVLDYLDKLRQNNNREWYHANKQMYKDANSAFEIFIQDLIREIRKFDGSIPLLEARDLTFKIVRDTRFSHDKSPYNPSFRAHIASKGKLPIPVGYYVMISPGGHSFLGGGLFADMFKDATEMVRHHIEKNGPQWQEILESPNFKTSFKVGGTALKNVPKGYNAEHPQSEYLKNKSWYIEFPLSDAEVSDSDFLYLTANTFEKMKPFNDFLNCALTDFQLPSR